MSVVQQNCSCRDKVILMAFAVVPFIGFFAPRFLAFWPSIVGFLSVVYFCAFKKETMKIDWQLIGLVLAPALLGVFSLLWTQSYDTSIDRVQKTSLLLVGGTFFLSSLQFYRPLNAKLLLYVMSISMALLSVLICYEVSNQLPLYRMTHGIDDPKERVLLAVYNRSAICLALMSAVLIVFAYTQRLFLPMTLLLLLVIHMSLYSASQSLLFACSVGLLSVLVFPYRSKWSWCLSWLVITVLSLSALYISQWVFSHARDVEFTSFLHAASVGPRLEIWDYVSRYAMDSPWFGHGIEVTRTIDNFDSGEVFQAGKSILHPHNFAVQLWMEFGLFGVLFMAGYLAILFKRLAENALETQMGRVYFPLFVIVLCFISTAYSIWQGWWLGLVLLSVGLAKHLSKREQ